MLILSPHLYARLDSLMLALSTGDASPCTGGVTSNKNGGLQLGLAFVLRRKNVYFLHLSVHFASMIDNIVRKVKYFWTLPKTKHYSSVEMCSS
jgi:hypothetical protein